MEKWQQSNISFSVAQVIDSEGYRANVGIILANRDGHVFWGRRFGQRSWQFPQGGIKAKETPEDAMYRELAEETGLQAEHVEILGWTRQWLRYQLPQRFIRRNCHPVCIGQKQIWYLLSLVGEESDFDLEACERPEFDFWQWVDYWYPSGAVVHFKRSVYSQALRELAPLLPPDAQACRPRSSGRRQARGAR